MGRDRVVKPGGRYVDMGRIRPGSSVKDVIFRQGGAGQRVGTMTEEIVLANALGLPAVQRTTVLESEKLGVQRTLSVVEADSLRPMAYEAHLPSLDVSARYQDGRVTGLRKKGTHTQLGSGLEIPRDAFDIGSIEILIRAIDFSEGWAGKFNVVDPVGGRVTRGRLVVRGRENVDDSECWAVTSIVDTSRVEYAVARDGSSIVRQSFSPRKGVTIEFFDRSE
jgi:hypothetical protein